MYKLGSFEQELEESMQKHLVSNKLETEKGFSKLAKAADLLNMAAEIFEAANMNEEADDVTQVLQNLLNNIK